MSGDGPDNTVGFVYLVFGSIYLSYLKLSEIMFPFRSVLSGSMSSGSGMVGTLGLWLPFDPYWTVCAFCWVERSFLMEKGS